MSGTASSDFTFSAEVFKYWILDHDRSQIQIYLQDGRVLSEPTRKRVSRVVSTSCFDWENWWMISQTRRSDIIITEVYSRISSDKNRPSVYLDQNHWSTLAWSRVDPRRVRNENELIAAQRLVELAQDAAVILPLSSCHLNEISPLFGNRRYELGVAMARLSGGWLFRHPMAVLANEALGLASAISHGIPPKPAPPVVTLEPYACFLPTLGQEDPESRSDFELLRDAMACPSVVLDQLIEDDNPKNRVDITAWVEGNQRLTDHFRSTNPLTPDLDRILVSVFWQQHIEILARAMRAAYQTPEDLARLLLEGALRPGVSEPFAALYYALFKRRLLDGSTKWKANDLNDMTYLSCGAAYANYVVAEKHTGTQLRQISESKGERRNIHTSLADLVAQLAEDGVRTVSERSSNP